jgi:putative ABC transport system permease protein
MIRLSLRNLTSRPLRTVLTSLAVVLGVAMVCGTYILTDQIDKGFGDIFSTAYKGTAVVVSPKVAFVNSSSDQSGGPAKYLTAATVDKVRAVPGVAKAAGAYQAMGAVLIDGKLVGTGGSPTLLIGDPGQPFSAATQVAGRAPAAPNEVDILQAFAEKQHLKVGDTFQVAAPKGMETVRVAGTFDYAAASSLGGTIMVIGRMQDVQRWGGEPGHFNEVDAAAAVGVKPADLAARVKAALPADVKVQTGEQMAAQQTQDTAAQINTFLRPMLLTFAAISVFVGAFIIFNAFSITVAQRRREFAMLRALGASRRQVLTTVVVEALALGALASAIGIAAGIGVAWAINSLIKVIGGDIPVSGIVLLPRTVLIAVAVGVVVTLLSSLLPAMRATRVPPVAALQEGATLPPTRLSRLSSVIAAAIGGLGVAALVYGIVGNVGATNTLALMGIGALLLFVAVAMLAKWVVRPLARVIGWPLQVLAPTSGRLARDNAGRNPSRTAATAAALMIGLALVVFIAVFAQALKGSFGDSIGRATRADLVIQDRTAYMNLPAKGLHLVQLVPGVEVASGAAFGQLQLKGGSVATVNAIDPSTFGRTWQFDWRKSGSNAVLGRMDATHVIVEEGFANGYHFKVGSTFAATAQTGRKTRLTVVGIYKDQMLFGGITATMDTFRRLGLPTATGVTLVKTDGTRPAATQAAVQRAITAFPTFKVDTRTQYLDAINKQVDQMLMMLYGLLAMAVIISIFGIVNTLVLSVHERTREIGMLRAIGASRRQLGQMVRYESVITAVIGGVLGIAVGVAFGYLVITQIGAQGLVFSVPWLQLAVFLVLSVVVGVLAAVLPARRAARTRILEAIQYE